MSSATDEARRLPDPLLRMLRLAVADGRLITTDIEAATELARRRLVTIHVHVPTGGRLIRPTVAGRKAAQP